MDRPAEPDRSPAPASANGSGSAGASKGSASLDRLPVLSRRGGVVGVGRGGAFGVEGLPAALSRTVPGTLMPVAGAAAAAAGGFAAGAAVVGLVHRRRRRAMLRPKTRAVRRLGGAGRGGRGSSRAGELVQIIHSRSLLLDVHLLGER